MKYLAIFICLFATISHAEELPPTASHILETYQKSLPKIQSEELVATITTSSASKVIPGEKAPAPKNKRKISLKRKVDSKTGEQKVLVTILEPVELQGLKLLSHKEPGKPETQWMYLPKLKKVQRITGAKKKGKFAGSEFTFEDLAGLDFSGYEFSETVTNENPDFRLTATVKDPNSDSKTAEFTFIQKNGRLKSLRHYGKDYQILKTAIFSNHKALSTGETRPFTVHMISSITNLMSVLNVESIKVNHNISDSVFSLRALKR